MPKRRGPSNDTVGTARQLFWLRTRLPITHDCATLRCLTRADGGRMRYGIGSTAMKIHVLINVVVGGQGGRCPPRRVQRRRGATTAEQLRGKKPGWVLGAGGGRPSRFEGPGGITPGKFVKTQILNPAVW